tara:strand:- start:1418 stop:3199 length:1782 start_codon:yes stop_codon:yes gene_type:complete
MFLQAKGSERYRDKVLEIFPAFGEKNFAHSALKYGSSESTSNTWGKPPLQAASGESASASGSSAFQSADGMEAGPMNNPEKGTKANPIYVQTIASNLSKFQAAFSIILFCGLGIFLYKGASAGKNGGSNLFGMQTSVHKAAKPSDVTFDDVLGVDEAKGELAEIVSYLREPEKFTKIGATLPKGVLLTGAPGTGKTLLARAIAGEAQVPFYFASGAEFDEVFVGLGSKRIRQLFEDAKANAPCIIFIDEIDTIGGSRKGGIHINKDGTLNQLLTELDGFEKNSGVVLIGATNLPDSIDEALKRSGRFDKIVHVPVPDMNGRKQILLHYFSKVQLDPEVTEETVDRLAKTTVGMTGADLANLVNQAAVRSAVANEEVVKKMFLEEAYDDMIMGVGRKSAIISDEEKKLTAYHEGGHALVAWHTRNEGSSPIRKATILPRGSALGFVAQLPEKDQLSMSRKQMTARICCAMAGRLSERLIFGDENLTSGASSDLMQANRLASEMVLRWGMSDKVGPIYVDPKDRRTNDISAKTLELIDEEVKRILEEQEERARLILERNKEQLHDLAEALIKYETLDYDDINIVLSGRPLYKKLL